MITFIQQIKIDKKERRLSTCAGLVHFVTSLSSLIMGAIDKVFASAQSARVVVFTTSFCGYPPPHPTPLCCTPPHPTMLTSSLRS